MANLNLSQFTTKTLVEDADWVFVWDTAGAISKKVSRNSLLNSGTLATSAPVTISQTWSTTDTYTAAKIDVTETATANSLSKLLDLQVGGASKFSVNKAGQIRMLDCIAFSLGGTDRWSFGNTTTSGRGLILNLPNNAVHINSNLEFGWASGTAGDAAADVRLFRDAANTLALRNGALAQTFNVYGTYSAAGANYARLALTCALDGNATISTQALGTGVAGTVSINGVPVGLGKGNISTSVAIGSGALNANTTGSNNLALGANTLFLSTTATFNSALGENALRETTTGSFNVALGASAMQLNSTGASNTAVGVTAGAYAFNGGTSINNTTSSFSVFLGRDTKPDNIGQTNQIVIGYNANGLGSNTAVLGNASITTTALRGNVGIGTTAPASGLHVAGALGANVTTYDSAAALKLTNTTGSSSWLLTSGVIGVLNASFCIRQESTALPALTIASTTNNVGIGTTAPSSKLHVAGEAFLAVNGTNTAPSLRIGAGANINGWYSFGGVQLNGVVNSQNMFGINSTGTNIGIGNLSFGSGDVVLERDAQDELALRRGAVGQKFSVYGTYPGAAWERFSITAPTSGNVLLGTYKGTGGIARGLELQTDGVTRMTIAATGEITSAVTISSQSSLSASSYIMWVAGSSSRMLAPSNGIIQFTDSATTGFDRLQFGATADTHPAIARDGAGIKFTGAAAGLTSHIKVPAVAVGSLPAAATAGVGARAFVNDATAPVFGSAVTGGGSVPVPVYSTGSAWNVG